MVANPSGMGGRLPEFNSISRLPPDFAREIIISRNAPNFVLYRPLMVEYRNIEMLDYIGIVNKMGYDTLTGMKCYVIKRLSFVR